MTTPWDLYDNLIDSIPEDLRVSRAIRHGQWCRVTSSEGGVGLAFNTPIESRPRLVQDDEIVGQRLRDVAALSKSWNFAEATYGIAAINAWYCLPERASAAGFLPSRENNFAKFFDPWKAAIAGRRVGVVGHYPFAAEALAEAAELLVFERNLRDADYPDTAVEYLLPTCDLAFITGSSLINKTAPRLLELAAHCPTTVIVGPSTPASRLFLDYGVDAVLSFASSDTSGVEAALGGTLVGKNLIGPRPLGGLYEAGCRIELHATTQAS